MTGNRGGLENLISKILDANQSMEVNNLLALLSLVNLMSLVSLIEDTSNQDENQKSKIASGETFFYRGTGLNPRR